MKFHPALAAKLVLAAALLTPEAAQSQLPQAASPHIAPQAMPQAVSRFGAASYQPVPLRLLRTPIARRCLMPKLDLSNEAARLGLAGYTKLSLQSRKSYQSRCAQLLYFTACKGVSRYRVIVRYIRSKRSVVALRQGSCLVRVNTATRRRLR
jgi:hypothetical protein